MARAIVVAPAAIAAPVSAIGDSEHALDRAHGAADAGPNRTTDHAAHRAGDPVTFIRAFLRAANDGLGMSDMGKRQQGEHDGGHREREPRR